MCYPDADASYEAFIKALEQFKTDLNQVLLYDQSIKERYKRIHKVEESEICYIYLQPRNSKLVKIVVNFNIDNFDKEIVDIFAEDVTILKDLENLDSVNDMRKHMKAVHDVVSADRVMTKLTHPGVFR